MLRIRIMEKAAARNPSFAIGIYYMHRSLIIPSAFFLETKVFGA